MGIIGRREFHLIMKMDDQTSREREALNRGLGDVEKTAKRSAKEAEAGIVQVAKASKQNIEGIKAVLELGGWLMMAQQVGKAFMDITAEARKNSDAFKEAGGALEVVKQKIGAGLVKALEPLAEGFKNVLIYGTAIFQNFPEVAKASFDFVKAIITKALSWEGLKSVVVALGEGIITVFRAALEYIPKLFVQMIQLLLNPIYRLGEYIADVLSKAFTLKFKEIESPGSFMARIMTEQTAKLGEIVAGAKDYVMAQASNVKATAAKIGDTFAPEAAAFAARVQGIIGPTVAGLNADVAGQVAKGEKPAAASPFASIMDDWNMKLVQQTGDKLAILDAERAMALGKLGEQLKDQEEFGAAAVQVNAYYDNEAAATRKAAADAALAAEIKHNAELAQADAEGRALALKEAQAAAEERRRADLAGENGLGGAVAANLAGSEVMGGAAAGPMGLVFSLIGQFASSIENLGAVLNPIQTIMKAAFEVLAPVINNLLAPLVGILRIMGMTIGRVLAPALELLRPIIVFIAELFTWIYNKIFVPIANAIIMLFNLIYNGFAAFVNGILWLIDQIPFVDVGRVAYRELDAGTLSEISTDQVAAAGASSSGSSGGSASYAAGTSITIEKIEIRADFIAGDAGLADVAVMLRDKLLEAERAGR